MARSIGELRQIVQTINDRRNLGLDVEAILENATTRSTYLDEPIELKPQSTERGRVRGLLKGQKGAPLNLG